MTNKSPIFTIHEPHHFSDYGFDPQIDYFQAFEEAITHKRDSFSFRSAIDTLHFKLQKPVSKDNNSKKIKKSRKQWWKNVLYFFKRRRTPSSSDKNLHRPCGGPRPVYLAESRSGYSTPYRPYSGPLAGTMHVPYIDLNEFNMHQTHRLSPTPVPIYLVT